MGKEKYRKPPEKVLRAIREDDVVGLKKMARAGAEKRARNADLKKAVAEFEAKRAAWRRQKELADRAREANEHIVPIDDD